MKSFYRFDNVSFRLTHQEHVRNEVRYGTAAAMQRLRAGDGTAPPPSPAPSPAPAPTPAPQTPSPAPPDAPRAAFTAQRFPLHYGNNEDINRQLRDLLQRHPDKMWPPRTYRVPNITLIFISKLYLMDS